MVKQIVVVAHRRRIERFMRLESPCPDGIVQGNLAPGVDAGVPEYRGVAYEHPRLYGAEIVLSERSLIVPDASGRQMIGRHVQLALLLASAETQEGDYQDGHHRERRGVPDILIDHIQPLTLS